MSATKGKSETKSKKLKMPNTYVVVATIVAIVAIASWFIPPGSYEYEQMDVNGTIRNVAVNGSFQYLPEEEANPTDFFEYVQAFYLGAVESANIIFVIFTCSGTFGILVKTGAFHAGIGTVLRKMGGKEVLLVPLLMSVFALGGSLFGMLSEFYGFIPLIVGLGVAMGYDAMFGFAIIALGEYIGFMGSTLNPYTVAVSQSIAGVELYSGMTYRVICLVFFIAACAIYVLRYGKKIKANPQLSVMLGEPSIHAFNRADLDNFKMDKKTWLLLLDVLVILGILMNGMMNLGWGYSHLCALFLIMSWVAAIIYGWDADKWVAEFIDSVKVVVWGAILTGVARGIVIIMEDAMIMDTVIFHLSNVLADVPSFLSAQAMLFVQTLINLFIPSGSGQAAATMPIMAPMADMIGVSRQVATLTFQFGDGLSNLFWPTCGIVTICGIGGIPIQKWWKWFIPLAGIIYVMQMIFVAIAVLIGY